MNSTIIYTSQTDRGFACEHTYLDTHTHTYTEKPLLVIQDDARRSKDPSLNNQTVSLSGRERKKCNCCAIIGVADSPESPPNVETHCVEPEERRQKYEVHRNGCNKQWEEEK